MTRASWVELCMSNVEQSISWFENVLGFTEEYFGGAAYEIQVNTQAQFLTIMLKRARPF